MSRLFDYDPDDIPSDVREEMYEERRRRIQARHWCDECHGHTGPGSPCHIEPDPEPEPEPEEDEGDDEPVA